MQVHASPPPWVTSKWDIAEMDLAAAKTRSDETRTLFLQDQASNRQQENRRESGQKNSSLLAIPATGRVDRSTQNPGAEKRILRTSGEGFSGPVGRFA